MKRSCIVLLFGSAVLATVPAVAEERPPVPVTTARLSDVVFLPVRTAPATAVSLNDAQVSAEIGGVLMALPVKVGDRVKEGDVVAQVDCREPEIALVEARASMWRDLLQRARGNEHDIASDIPDVELRTEFQNGLQALNTRDFDRAIRICEGLAKQVPKSFAANLFAARANMGLMEKIGWDVGYFERAARYLGRAESLRPDDDEVHALELALRKLEEAV